MVLAAQPVVAEETVEFSGQLSPLLVHVRSGDRHDTALADNAAASSRIGLKGRRSLHPDFTVGFFIESSFVINPSNRIGFGDATTDLEIDERHIDAFVTGPFGKLSVGRGDGAANSVMDTDLSGTKLASHSAMTDIGGGFVYSGNGDEIAIRQSMSNQDFESRYRRLRYDLPPVVIGRIAISAGTKVQNEVFELAWRQRHIIAGRNLHWSLGHSVQRRGGTRGSEQTFGGAMSVGGDNGPNLTLAASQLRDNRTDRRFAYAKLGYRIGRHAVAIDYGLGMDFARLGDRADAGAFSYNYEASDVLDFYGVIKRHTLDRELESPAAVTVVSVGASFRLN